MDRAEQKQLVDAVKLGIMMLGIEAQIHRENQELGKATAVEKAIASMQRALKVVGEEL